MTCIVGIEHNGQVYLGGDSAGVAGLDIVTRADEKVFRNEEFVMGFTSSFRMGQILRYAFKPPEQSFRKDDMQYMVTDFIDAVREVYRQKGYLHKSNEVESGGTFLVGYRGKLYCVESDFQVGRVHHGFDACGCGYAYAMGALHATSGILDKEDGSQLGPNERLQIALEAAARFSAGVRPPFVFVNTGK